MALLTAQNLSLAFGWRPLLLNVNFSLYKGEKIALLGRNGEGKSTLLNVLRGKQMPDDGEVKLSDGVSVAYLPQDPPAADERTVIQVVKDGFKEAYAAMAAYEALLANFDDSKQHELDDAEKLIQSYDAWTLDMRIEGVLQQFELNADTHMSALSGGWRRRVWLARVVVKKPDILLLDEPTNHLDIGAIKWLENFLNRFAGAVVFVTHDRAFMQNVANRIWELDRGMLTDVVGTYERFLQTREEILHAESEAQAKFDKKLAQEEVWIRKGIQARRTRNEGRVRALKAMRAERVARVDKQNTASLRVDSGNKSGKQVIIAEKMSFQYPNGQMLVHEFTDIIERGEKIGLIGANGMGKTTLINVLLGKLAPSKGEVKLGTNLEIAYFDQLRGQLEPNQTLRENLGQGKDYVEISGQRKHVAAYLQDFLFPPERWNTPVSALSGGEKARLLLAKLFAQPANFLVFDEPTNDLDIETLELLEEVLVNYTGTALIVSHDRVFLDDVATRSWVFNAAKQRIDFVPGGFTDWLRQGGSIEQLEPLQNTEIQAQVKSSISTEKKETAKLSYKFQRELEKLPEEVEKLEALIQSLNEQVAATDFYTKPRDEQESVYAEIEKQQMLLDKKMERWMQLDAGKID